MIISKFAKSREELYDAPLNVRLALENYVEYHNHACILRTDIVERFDYPSLWAAIDRLMEHVKHCEVAFATMENAGFTSDDAIQYAEYEKYSAKAKKKGAADNE